MSDDAKQNEHELHAEGPDRPAAHRSFSFSLRGLIAVITLLAIVLALIVPVIARMREAARRAQCQNNLKQLALAAHNYESAFKAFPIGIQVIPGRNDSPQTRAANWSWSVFTTPYLAPGGLYDVLNPRKNNCFSDRMTQTRLVEVSPTRDNEGNPVSISLSDVMSEAHYILPEFKCPSDHIASRQNTMRSGVQDSNGSPVTSSISGNVFELGIMSYVGANSSTQCFALIANSSSANGETINVMPDGLFHAVRATKLRDLRDGQSNIVMFSERISGSLTRGSDRRKFGREISAGAATAFGCRGIGNSSIDGSATNDVADAWGTPDVLFSAWGGINLDDPVNPWRKFQGVSSYHPGGVNIANADGSVEFFANTDVSANLKDYVPLSIARPSSAQWETAQAEYDLWMSNWKLLNVWRRRIGIDDTPGMIVN